MAEVREVYKYQGCSGDLVVKFTHQTPEMSSLEAQRALFEDQGAELEDCLRRYLPGGTYDQLLAAMMKHAASILVVQRR